MNKRLFNEDTGTHRDIAFISPSGAIEFAVYCHIRADADENGVAKIRLGSLAAVLHIKPNVLEDVIHKLCSPNECFRSGYLMVIKRIDHSSTEEGREYTIDLLP